MVHVAKYAYYVFNVSSDEAWYPLGSDDLGPAGRHVKRTILKWTRNHKLRFLSKCVDSYAKRTLMNSSLILLLLHCDNLGVLMDREGNIKAKLGETASTSRL